jgi:hypothetical protein
MTEEMLNASDAADRAFSPRKNGDFTAFSLEN